MATSSRMKRRAMRNPKRAARGNRSNWFNISVATIVVLGVTLLLVNRDPNSAGSIGPKISGPGGQPEHWHAALGVYVCGVGWESTPVWPISTASRSIGRKDSPSIYAGLHTHVLADGTGDGIVHMEPAASDEAGRNATIGRYTKFAGWKLTGSSMSLWPGKDGKAIKHKNGDKCDKGKKTGKIRWAVGRKTESGKTKMIEQKGSPAGYKLYDDDVVAIYFVSADEKLDKLGEVPSIPNLTGATERGEGGEPPATTVPGGSTTTVAGGTTTTGGTGTTTTGGSATTAAPPTTVAPTTIAPTPTS